MDFTSQAFQFGFLPLVIGGFWFLQVHAAHWSVVFLVLASLAFLGANSGLSLAVIIVCVGITRLSAKGLDLKGPWRAASLTAGISTNLLLLAYFKIHPLSFDSAKSAMLVAGMPLGLSFYAFKQITYLVDRHQKRAPDLSLKEYALFSFFFAHLPAGPITPYKTLQPQIAALTGRTFNMAQLLAGLSLYVIGFFKYTVFASQLGMLTAPIYSAAQAGNSLCFPESIVGSFGFLLQLYFDFSAYSDMAVGLALCFGLVLSPNFDSPLKASRVTDYVMRWHMSMMVFARDYVFRYLQSVLAHLLPFRSAVYRRFGAWALATCGTFVLVMLWHDAGWLTLIISLGTAFLVIASGLSRARGSRRPAVQTRMPPILGLIGCIAMASVTIVFFRASDLSTSIGVFSGFGRIIDMLPWQTAGQMPEMCPVLSKSPEDFLLLTIFAAAAVSAFAMPNSMRIFGILPPNSLLSFKPGLAWGMAIGVLIWASWLMHGQIARGFIYERF